jgi:hypothetical protein
MDKKITLKLIQKYILKYDSSSIKGRPFLLFLGFQVLPLLQGFFKL